MAIRCPECGANSFTLNSRNSEQYFRRRRQCTNGHRFTTVELVLPDARKIIESSFVNILHQTIDTFLKERIKVKRRAPDE